MKYFKLVILVIAVSLAASFFGTRLFSGQTKQIESNKPVSLLSMVLEKGEIRAGYVIDPPALIKDPNTGALSGIFYDTMQEAGKNLGLKINWVEEAGWGTMIEGLEAGRYDIIVTDLWPNAARSKSIDFTNALYYIPIGVYVRPGDNRFSNLNAINSSDITIATIDGEMSSLIAQTDFSQAKVISLAQDTPVSQVLLNVSTKKADVTFAQPAIAEEFLANNPGAVENIAKENPVRYFPNTMGVPKDEEGFKSMINTALEELLNNGTMDRLIAQYEKYDGSYYPVAKPYILP